jgi:hypothetical protein
MTTMTLAPACSDTARQDRRQPPLDAVRTRAHVFSRTSWQPLPSPRSSRPTTSAGLYGEQIDGDVAEAVGRRFIRVLAEGADKAPGDLRVGLGRDMRLTAPELAARYRDGMVSEGAHVLDAGQVGHGDALFLVGSRSSTAA